MSDRLFSKSQYTRELQCRKSLWMYRHQPELRTPISAADQMILDQGTQFGALARERFAGGVLIQEDHDHQSEAAAHTTAAIDTGAKVLYEAALIAEGVIVRVDILVKTPDGKSFDMYEVKSSTKVKDEHLDDVAAQRWVAEKAGLRVLRAFVVHANPAYVRRGELDLSQLFAVVDVTAESAERMLAVPNVLAAAKQADALDAPPTIDIGAHCSRPYDCDFRDHCWAHVPEYSVFNLSYAKMEQKLKLWNGGVREVHQVNPALHKLPPQAARQVAAARAGKPMVDARAIAKLLATLGWPRYFLDFETINPVLPPFDGLSPYQQIPTQASVHVQSKRGGTVDHHEFVGDGIRDPRPLLVEFLCGVIGPGGPVIAYHSSFEGGRLTELADWLGAGVPSQHLRDIEKRLWDLATTFRQGLYVHPGFEGRWSVKAILPVLVPDLKYDGLAIRDGEGAMAAYNRLRSETLSEAERAQIVSDLKAYCSLDTLAMVSILECIESALLRG